MQYIYTVQLVYNYSESFSYLFKSFRLNSQAISLK